MTPLKGLVAPLVTPFDSSLKVDAGALRSLCESLTAAGVDAFFPLGTTGEFLALSSDERKQVAEMVIDVVGGRAPVVVHVGCFAPPDTLDLALHALAIGADGVAVVTPYYFKLSQQELEEYYVRVCSSLPDEFPVYMYVIPSHTGNTLEAGTVQRLLNRCPNIVGLKFSSPDHVALQEYARLRRPAGEPIACLVGCDEDVLSSLVVGAAGVVSGHANVAPELLKGLIHATADGRFEDAKRLQGVLARISDVFAHGSVPRIKAYLAQRGFGQMRVRPPLLDLPSDSSDALFQTAQDLIHSGATRASGL